ncbi:MAG: hypothetical protein ACJ790_00510 [Myxococcaceae bacterium]
MTADPATLQAALDRLGGYEPDSLSARTVGTFAFVATVVAVGWIERAQYRLKRLEGSKWWASNGRDVLNVVALLVLMSGLRMMGFRGPLSFGIAGTMVIVLSAIQMTLSKHKHQAVWSVGLGLLLSAPVLIAPAQVDALFTRTLTLLFGG